MARETGRYETASVAGETVAAFVPFPLPPANPTLKLDKPTQAMLHAAETNLARLDGAGRMVPSVDRFVYAFSRREAVVSSQIEGTRAALIDVLRGEADLPTDAPVEHVEDVRRCLDAWNYARGELRRKRGLPLSMSLLHGSHRRLLAGSRGLQAGKIRRSQNGNGAAPPPDAPFVPPPPDLLAELLRDLECQFRDDESLPLLVRAGLLHAQFEMIHPYLHGNGRVGRLLIALALEEWGLLHEPLLYLSLFFQRHRQAYLERLDAVWRQGDWEGWIAYFLEGVAVIADESTTLIAELVELAERDRRRVVEAPRTTVAAVRLFDRLWQNPIVTVKSATQLCQTSRPTATSAVNVLRKVGILEETSGKRRDHTYRYSEYVDHLCMETELDD